MKRRTVLSGLALACAAGSSLHAAEAAGTVETVRGEAFAQTPGNRRSLAAGTTVFIGDTIVTSAQSALSLRLGTATLVRLGPDAALRIDRYLMNVGGTLELARGPMVFLHDPGAAAPGVAVRSPFGLIAVRGTRFFAGPSNGVFGVFVDEGAVSVVGVNTAVEVTAGLGTDIAHPGEEPTNPHPWGRARIEAAFASVR